VRVAASFCLLLLLALGGLGSVAAATPEETFSRANEAYEQRDYASAAEGYRSLLRYRIRDPRVEYNLGNAEFKLGNLGRAILSYERARRLDPTDPDIRANLAYARSLTFDRVEPAPMPGLVRMIYTLQDRLGPDRQAWIGLALFWIAAGLLAWGLSGPGRWTAACGWSLTGLVLLLAISVASWNMTYQRLEGTPLAVVLQDSVEVLAGPGFNNATLFTVHEGLTVEVRGEVRQDWVQVSLPNGLNGWVPLDAVGLV